MYQSTMGLAEAARNRLWNVDVFGVLRGRYLTPAFAVKIGERNIRNMFKSTLVAIEKEGLDHMGSHPCIIGELGIPYDMNNSQAYKTGDYASQTSAMDANHFAVEGAKVNYTLWNYTGTVRCLLRCSAMGLTDRCQQNVHKWGDQWNGEDLSVYSKDDLPLPSSSHSSDPTSSAAPTHRKDSMTLPPEAPESEGLLDKFHETSGTDRLRAAPAYVRPYPIATHGNIVSYGFDLKTCVFELRTTANSTADESAPTEVFLPDYHFPADSTAVEVSAGRWTMDREEKGGVSIPVLRWWPPIGEQKLRVKGSLSRLGMIMAGDGDGSFIERCQERVCVIM